MFFKNKLIQQIADKLGVLCRREYIILLIGVLSILPFIIISFYANPSSDDFNYNIISQEIGYWDAQKWFFNNYNGRFFTSSILSIQILVSESFILYKLIPIFVLILFFYSIFKLFSILFKELSTRDHIILTFYLLFIYLVQMPHIASGLYWLSGAICYQLPNILTVFLLCFLIKLFKTNEIKYLILSILCAFVIIGSNEVSMLVIDFLIGVIFIFKSIQNKNIYYPLLILLIVVLLLSIIVYIAPGNTIRSSWYPNNNNFFAVIQSINSMIRYLGRWLPLILLSTFIFYDYFNEKFGTIQSEIFNFNPFFVLLVISSVIFIGFFTHYWATGLEPPDRVINIIYFYCVLGLIYLSLVLYFKLKRNNIQFISFSKWVKFLIIIIIIIRLNDKGDKNNLRLVYSDLISGKAYNYDMELKKRYEIIENCKKDTCYVPKLTAYPLTIFFTDIRNDSNYWGNQCYESFFGIKRIIPEN